MGKFMKQGRVVLVLSGRFAGRKAVIVKVSSDILNQILACISYVESIEYFNF